MGIAIFDLDGCISDDRHRRHLLPREAADFDAYHTLCELDPPANLDVVAQHRDDDIIFITARPESVRQQTARWLAKHVSPHTGGPWFLLMRPNGSNRQSPELKVSLFDVACGEQQWPQVVAAYDDRDDVLVAYRAKGVRVTRRLAVGGRTAADILADMAKTFRERNAVYGDNYKMVAPLIRVLFPNNGVPPELVTSDRWHLFELMVVKLSRFAISNLTHADSIHDAAVYAAMIEADLEKP